MMSRFVRVRKGLGWEDRLAFRDTNFHIVMEESSRKQDWKNLAPVWSVGGNLILVRMA